MPPDAQRNLAMSGSHLLSVHDELTVCTSASTNGACSAGSRGGSFTTEGFTVPPGAAVPELDLARIRAYCEQKVPARYRAEARVEMGCLVDCHRRVFSSDGGMARRALFDGDGVR